MEKFELALMYYPNSSTKKAATDRLRGAIRRCKKLETALINSPGGYDLDEKDFTPQQVDLIKLYLGEP